MKQYLLFTVLATIILLSGCNKKEHAKSTFTIGFSQCIGADFWRQTMLEEMKMELSLQPGSKLIYSDAGGNNQKQISQVRDMLRQGIDLLIISPNEAQPLTGIVEQAYLKGIPVIVIDRKTASNLYTAYVGADNYQIGKMAAQYLGTTLKENAHIMQITGLAGSSPAIERQKGFEAGIKRFANIGSVTTVAGNWLKDDAVSILKAHQQELHNTDAVFAQNDVMAEGARQLINRLGINRPVKIIGVDALPGNGGGLQMVLNKTIDASLLYPTGGKEAIITAFRILNHESYNKENILESVVIDSSNVQLMKMQWNRISSQLHDIERQQSLLEEQRAIYRNQAVILNILVITLVLAIIFGGVAFYSLIENRKINNSLEKKNQQILQQKNELLEMSAKAQVATEAKLNFFTNISHEFRTPLTLMLGPVEDLLRQKKPSVADLKNLSLVHKNIFILLKLVNQLIDYRKIEYEGQRLKASPNNIILFIDEILDNFKHLASKRKIDLRFIHEERSREVWFDLNLLDKVFFNLISNSFKFVNDNGRIYIRLFTHADEVVIEIEDNGIGMTEEQSAQVFDHFYQVDHGLSNASGLGLALTKEIILLHHGTIQVKSKKWQSTVFTITLPTGDGHLKDEEKSAMSIDKEQIVVRSRNYLSELEIHAPKAPLDTFTSPKEYSILVVEDNPDLLQYLTAKLQNEFEVFTAVNGKMGISEAFERVPDLILSDVLLPEMNGKELTRTLKSDMRTSHIPIILLTAQSNIDQQIEGMATMADAYLTKPFNFDFLMAAARNLINNRAILKEHFTSDISKTDRMPVSKALDKKFLNDLAGIIEQNLSNENLSVELICKSLSISRIQLYRKVKALLGCSITDYILNRRLKKAKYLLGHEGKTISEVTYMVGFATPSYFSTVFKAKYGCTPSEYKKRPVE